LRSVNPEPLNLGSPVKLVYIDTIRIILIFAIGIVSLYFNREEGTEQKAI